MAGFLPATFNFNGSPNADLDYVKKTFDILSSFFYSELYERSFVYFFPSLVLNRYASMNGRIFPSRTPAVSDVSTPVRRSFTI